MDKYQWKHFQFDSFIRLLHFYLSQEYEGSSESTRPQQENNHQRKVVSILFFLKFNALWQQMFNLCDPISEEVCSLSPKVAFISTYDVIVTLKILAVPNLESKVHGATVQSRISSTSATATCAGWTGALCRSNKLPGHSLSRHLELNASLNWHNIPWIIVDPFASSQSYASSRQFAHSQDFCQLNIKPLDTDALRLCYSAMCLTVTCLSFITIRWKNIFFSLYTNLLVIKC